MGMKKSLIALSLISVVTLTACSAQEPIRSSTPDTSRLESGVIDEAVVALLPQGAFLVKGEFIGSEGPVSSIEGYVNFGSNPDGVDCESDYTLSNLTISTATEFLPTKVRAVRNAGALSWYQNVSESSKPGEWREHADIDAPRIPLLFAPTLIADDYGVGAFDGAGNGELCAIPLMARIMKYENGELTFDVKRAEAHIKARWDRFSEDYVDAVGVVGVERGVAVELLKETGLPSFNSIMERIKIEVTKNVDGSYEIVQRQADESISVRMILTPSEERAVEVVSGKGYFERVTEEVKSSGLTPSEYLNKQ